MSRGFSVLSTGADVSDSRYALLLSRIDKTAEKVLLIRLTCGDGARLLAGLGFMGRFGTSGQSGDGAICDPIVRLARCFAYYVSILRIA